MGEGLLSVIQSLQGSPGQELRIVLLGLDNAGKTTLLKCLASEEVTTVTPTQVGAAADQARQDHTRQRPLARLQAERLGHRGRSWDRVISRQELAELTEDESLTGVPLLVFANKQDLVTAAPAAEIAEGLSLHTYRDREWQIQACSALSGEGVQDGMNWISSQIMSRKK
uniref:ADP-ribosylation factor-like protein 3 n=1 Tax=Anas zonorhyncha TaxID=75864 RepID=A0A8B9UCV3_9AVES